ncbi:hypothetical protein PV327_009294 [Microctonus hyperodae]|uniref:Methionine aminopeptidase n=1 Tax=Microctonus hyperodae TaxID=165561 RepID=A0AA39FTY6_MICHY|nr:hypothetical protein PV327_009294 [Microctonus hyperodae]
MLRKNLISNFSSSRIFFNEIFRNNPKILSCKCSSFIPPEQKINNNSFGKYEVVLPWLVSARKKVPSYIPKPLYYETLFPEDTNDIIEIKNDNQIECIRESCLFAKTILNNVGLFIKPGVTTDYLDEQIHEMIINNGAYPSPLNYRDFPKSICTSVNNVACHGIPDNRPLQNGDILNVDITVYLNGYHGDCSKMFVVGEIDSEAKRLINITKSCLNAAIKICKPNENFCNIGNVIEAIADENKLSVVPAFVGHGIGQYFHGPPDIFHFANDYPGKMCPGMTFTIEPVLSQGGNEIEILDDGWTAVTTDDARTAQFEHTILITNQGCDILTY